MNETEPRISVVDQRATFAAHAMEGLLSQGKIAAYANTAGLWGGEVTITYAQAIARDSVAHADALLLALATIAQGSQLPDYSPKSDSM